MFMNRRNTVCLAGELQRYLVGATDLTAEEWYLCVIFCSIRKKGYESKKVKPRTRFNYSDEAKKLAQNHPSPRFKGKMFFEKEMMVAVKRIKKNKKLLKLLRSTDRKLLTSGQIKRRLAKKFGIKIGAKRLRKKAGQAIAKKFIPFVGQVSLVLDVVDAVTISKEIFDAVEKAAKMYNTTTSNVYKIKPDIHIADADGKVKQIYDFKFDRPSMTANDGTQLSSYNDKFTEDQRELFKKKAGGKDTIIIDQEHCKCKEPKSKRRRR
jgi:predicted hydrocarbon binding protein